MTENVGNLDQAIRIAAGLIILAIGLYYQSFWGLVGLVPLVTGLARRCPAYGMLRLASNRDEAARPEGS